MVRLPSLFLGLSLALAAGLFLTTSNAQEGPTLALKGGLIRTQTDTGDFVGTIVIRDGKIVAIGSDVVVPAGATVIDATKCVITPGLIDAHGTLGLNPAAAREGGREAALNIIDAVDPFAEDWRDAARQGVTAIYVQPSGSGNLGGSGAVLRVGPTDSADELALRAVAGVQVALGTAPRAETPAANPFSEFLRGRGINAPTTPTPAPTPPAATTLTRFAQYEQIRGQFDAAKKYGESKPAKKEQPKELLLRAIKGEIPVRVEVYHEDDLRNAMKLATDFGLRAVYEKIERGRPMPEEFTTSRSGLVLGPLLGSRPPAEVRKLALDGRRFAIGTFGDEPRATAGLRHHAAAAVAAGFPRDRVLRALTSDAAELLGVGEQLGRLAVGRSADLVVFAGDPLDPSTPVRFTLSQGKVTHDNCDAEPVPTTQATTPKLPDKLPPSYVLKTTRLLTSSGEFAPGELHVANGRVNGPSGSTGLVIDLGDAPVTPGLVAAQLTIAGESAPDADAGQLRATDGLATDDGRLRACRDAGFLTTVVAPSSSNVVAGVASVLRANEAVAPTDMGMKFVLSSAARSRERYPVSLAGQFELIDARLHGEPGGTEYFLPAAVRQALLAQRDSTLQTVRDRQLTACFEAQTRAEIRAALRLIAEHKLHGVLIAPRDLSEVADEIRQAGVPVIVGPVKPQEAERYVQGLVALGKAGVPLALGGDAGDPRTSAAVLVNAGLARVTARRALIGQPVDALGLPAGTGRLLPGDAADFVVWTGDPLDTTQRPAAVVVQGQRVAISASDEPKSTSTTTPAATPARPRGRGR